MPKNERLKYSLQKNIYIYKKTMNRFNIILSFSLLFAGTTAKAQTDTTDNIFSKVEVEADFKGGNDAWIKFLKKNLNGDIPVDNGAPTGRYTVLVKFVVSKDGSVSNIKALTKNGYGTEEEVVRIIEKSGQWTPAIQNGKPVNAYRRQPITFLVQEEGFTITTKEPYTLFTGTDNEISVVVSKVKAEDISVSISKGTIIAKGDGKFIVRVPNTDRVTIEITNSKKQDKKIGAASFEVQAPK